MMTGAAAATAGAPLPPAAASGPAVASPDGMGATRSPGFSLLPFLDAGTAGIGEVGPAASGAPAAPAASGDAAAAGAGEAGAASPAHPFVRFGRTLVVDTGFVLAAPLHWDRRDWTYAGLAAAGIALMTRFDERIAHSVQAHRNATTDRIARYTEPFGADRAFETIGAFYLAGLVFDDDHAKDVAADSVISSIIAGGLIGPVIKRVAGRSRPVTTGGEEDVVHPFGSGDSFPSGHTTEAFAVASVIATHYESTWVKAASYGLATLVGLARIDHNAHFASDVLAGALLGTVVGRTVVHLNDERRAAASGRSVTVGPVVTAHGAGLALHLAF